MRSKVILALAAGLALGACQHGPSDYPYMGGPDNFGEANRVTMAAQVIDPTPHYDTAVPEGSGEHAAQAVERYRTDKVKQPDKVRTSDIKAGGSGGGGAN